MPRALIIVGFAMLEEKALDMWVENITEKPYYCEVIKLYRKPYGNEQVNSDFTLNSTFSIVIDPFINDHFSTIKYVTYMGVRWKVTNLDISRPRVTISIGGVYNGQASET